MLSDAWDIICTLSQVYEYFRVLIELFQLIERLLNQPSGKYSHILSPIKFKLIFRYFILKGNSYLEGYDVLVD